MKKASKVMSRSWFLGIIGIIVLLVLAMFIPWGSWSLSSHPNPAGSYEEAVRRIEVIQASEGADFNPVCRAKFLTHGQKTTRVIIMVHGYTSCPQQFAALGDKFFNLGYNVLIVPLPHHGLADRMTEAHAELTAQELVAYADETVDIAQGLGEKVVMMGLSVGGATTSWAAQNRSDIDLAVIISPALGFKQIPTPLTAFAMNAYKILPDAMVWYDEKLKENVVGAVYSYPRYSRHALVQSLLLGYAIKSQANQSPPAAKKMIVVFNANDTTINNALTEEFVTSWLAHGANLSRYDFGIDLKLGHDLIDPTAPDQKVDVVYPVLLDLVGQ